MNDAHSQSVVQPLYIRVSPGDNVAIVVNQRGLPAGSRFADGLILVDAVPEAHKVALADIRVGEPVLRYNAVIGRAKRAIVRGSWVHEALLAAPDAPALEDCPLATAVPEPLALLEGYSFLGFRNADGSAGTKNIL